MSSEKITFKDMCDMIVEAGILQKPDGSMPTANEIWNYSPTGETYMIHEWYEEAKMVLLGAEENDDD